MNKTFPLAPIVENLAYVNLAVLPFHICNILLIVLKRNLHTNVFILLANLSVSDTFLQVFIYLIKSHHSKPIRIAVSTFHTSSILFTLAINLDRYLKVKYGLRYYEIVLAGRLAALITLTWTFAVLICVVPQLLINDDDKHLVWTFKLGFNIFCSFVMLLSSAWVVRTRNMHARAIAQQEDAAVRYNQEADSSTQTSQGSMEISLLGGPCFHPQAHHIWRKKPSQSLMGSQSSDLFQSRDPRKNVIYLTSSIKIRQICINNFFLLLGVAVHVRPRTDMAKLLCSMKKTTKEVIRMSFIAAFLIVIGSSFHILEFYWKNLIIHLVGMFANEMYSNSNPFVYITFSWWQIFGNITLSICGSFSDSCAQHGAWVGEGNTEIKWVSGFDVSLATFLFCSI